MDVQEIPLDELEPSPMNPRRHVDATHISELAGSIGPPGEGSGVLQPIIARPHPSQADRFEIVAGECRWRASREAGRETIPAFVRDLDDREVLEVQVIENVRRQDLHGLDEAEGYRELHERHGLAVPEIAAKVGKDPSTIYQRMQLCALAGKARKAFEEGKVSLAIAVKVARIPGVALQEEAVRDILDDLHGEPMTYREAWHLIQQRYLLRLHDAPFKKDDPTLLPDAGPCTICPKRTGNQRELFHDVKSPDLCTDPTCYAAKQDAAWKARAAQAKESGDTVLSDKEAKKLYPYGGGQIWSREYVDLDDRCYEDPKGRTYRRLLGRRRPPVTLARSPDKRVHELLPRKQISKALRARGHDFGSRATNGLQGDLARQRRSARDRLRLTDAVVDRVVDRIVSRAESRYPSVAQPILRACCRALIHGNADLRARDFVRAGSRRGFSHEDEMELLDQLSQWVGDASGEQVLGLLVELTTPRGSDSDVDFKDIAQAAGVDIAEVRKEVEADVKALAAREQKAKARPKRGGRKKAGRKKATRKKAARKA